MLLFVYGSLVMKSHARIPTHSGLPPQVQLDGTVRASALGAPNWGKLIDDLPPLNDIRTSLGDGVGTSV